MEASRAAQRGCRSTATAYGEPLRLGPTRRTKAKPPRRCVLGPEAEMVGNRHSSSSSAAAAHLDRLDGGGGASGAAAAMDPWDVAAAA
eukprot:COSAG01_NODE_22938_length_835_cov_1.266304_1_plen_87_part_10